MGARKIVAATVGLGCLLTPVALGFGGEDIARGKPWHHEDITVRALQGEDELYETDVKFSGGAESIAWHADNIDSYLYNPYFWAKGVYQSSIIQRTKSALVGFEDLAKLHFDDTFTTSGIRSNWERYAMGTLIGLLWASELPRDEGIAAGHHILGVSFHAVQDFYSHSNWVTDPNRRCATYFESPVESRNGTALWSGAYEKPLSGAPAHHGAYSLSCSVLRGDDMDRGMDTLCSSLSPIQNTSMCEKYRACSGAGTVLARLEDPITDGETTIYTNPPGIALDNTALTRAQAKNRGLLDPSGSFVPMRDGLHFPEELCSDIIKSDGGSVCELDADLIFAGTKDVAIRATIEWAEYLEQAMIAMGKGRYWNQLKRRSSGDSLRYAQFEDFSKLPYQFLAAGDYPVNNPTRAAGEPPEAARGWYLRLRIETADELGAGTDADIYARVRTPGGTRDILLDYLPTDDKTGRTNNRLLVYNDFERGDDDAYTIGPFAERPISVQLVNDAADFGDVFDALVEDFAKGIDETLTDARQFLIGFIGGNADFVGSNGKSFTAETLKTVFTSTRMLTDHIEVDGRAEGKHHIYFTLRNRPSALTADERDDGWVAMEVKLTTLHTVLESENDRGSNSDEPFVIFHIAPLNGRSDPSYTYLSPPFEDMDDDERAPFPSNSATRRTVKIPPEGILILSTAVYESDDENQSDRNTLKTKFETGMDQETQRPAAEFTDALGRALAEDWVVDKLSVYAFHRSALPLAGPVLEAVSVGDVDGDETSAEYQLRWNNITDIGAALTRAGVPTVLEFERDHPDAKTVLHGVWHSSEYQCAGDLPYMEVTVAAETESNRDKIIATKTKSDDDECYNEDPEETGQTFRGEFIDGDLIGERHITPPPRDRKQEADPDNPLDWRPNYKDAAIHPHIAQEGNWFIMFGDSSETPAYASLAKGGERGCYDYDGGCWYHYKRDPAAAWSLTYYQPSRLNFGAEAVTFEGGKMTVDWPYYMHGHWGGVSELSVGDGSMRGQWGYGDDLNGGEYWVKVPSAVVSTAAHGDDAQGRKPVGDPVTLTTNYVGHGYYMRGNRSSVALRLYGHNLWGLQYVFIPRHKDLEISGVRYICRWDGETGYADHPNWKVCMGQGGVEGLIVSMNVWPQAYSGDHVLHVNDQEIPFKLEVVNEPLREPEWQPMKMEFQSCSVLREVDRDYSDQPFLLIRQDFRRQN